MRMSNGSPPLCKCMPSPLSRTPRPLLRTATAFPKVLSLLTVATNKCYDCSGIVHNDLLNFLEAQLPKKKKKVTLGVGDGKLASAIVEQLGAKCAFTGVVPEILRGIRMHFAHLSKDLPHHSLQKAQLSLGHSYSRAKVGLRTGLVFAFTCI